MSENAVTFNSSRVTVSDMSVKRSNEPIRTRQRGPEQNSEPSQPAFSKSETLQVNSSSRVSTPSVTFVVDQDSGKSFIQVVDRDSGEILRQIPPEEARRLSEALEEMIGNVVDTLA
jgi:flagellar protein FlaG